MTNVAPASGGNSMTGEKQYDVIVVGGGNAALTAALASANEGAKTLMVEKAPEYLRGGNSYFTGGLVRVASSFSTNALWKPSAPMMLSTRPSNTVLSCQGWPPWARATKPAALSLSPAA